MKAPAPKDACKGNTADDGDDGITGTEDEITVAGHSICKSRNTVKLKAAIGGKLQPFSDPCFTYHDAHHAVQDYVRNHKELAALLIAQFQKADSDKLVVMEGDGGPIIFEYGGDTELERYEKEHKASAVLFC